MALIPELGLCSQPSQCGHTWQSREGPLGRNIPWRVAGGKPSSTHTGLLPWSCHPPLGAHQLTPTGQTSRTSGPSGMGAGNRGPDQDQHFQTACAHSLEPAPHSPPSASSRHLHKRASPGTPPLPRGPGTWVEEGRKWETQSNQSLPTSLSSPVLGASVLSQSDVFSHSLCTSNP